VEQMLSVGPYPVCRHDKRRRHRLAPGGDPGGPAPIVRDFRGNAILQLTDRDVAVDATISVVAEPLNEHEIVEAEAPSNFQRECIELGLNSRHEIAALHDFAHLRSRSFDVLGKGRVQDVFETNSIVVESGHDLPQASNKLTSVE
jgi:hypothetical protein